MFAPIVSLVAGMVLGAVLYSAGFRAGRKQHPASNTAVCLCEHHIGEHEQMTGKCHGQICVPNYMKSGDRQGRKWVPCTCQVYTGPELISSITLRPITPRAEASE